MDRRRFWEIFVYILYFIISSIYADTMMQGPAYIWVGDELTIVCIRSPSLATSKMVLLRDKIDVTDKSIGYTDVFSRNRTKNMVDELICTKYNAGYEEATKFECVTCYGQNYDTCPGGGATEEKSTGSIIACDIQPPADPFVPTVLVVPNRFSYVFMYTGPQTESLVNVRWLKNSFDAPARFIQTEGETTIGKYIFKTFNITKSPTDHNDRGSYMVQFTRNILKQNNTVNVIHSYWSWDIVTVGFTVYGPVDTSDDTSTIVCTAMDPEEQLYTNLDFYWEYFGSKIDSLPEFEDIISFGPADETESSISIQPSDATVAGEFTCVVSYFSSGTQHELRESFYLNAQAEVRNLIGNGSYTDDETLELTCHAWGWPLPEVTWKRNDQTIMDTSSLDRVTITETSDKSQVTSVLQISDMSINDAGQYRCEATNGDVSSQQYSFLTTDISIEVDTGITDISFPAIVQKGEDVTITCTNNPAQTDSTMMLFKDTTNVEDLQFSIIKTTTYNSRYGGNVDRLTAIKPDSSYSDAGMYVCHTCTGIRHVNCPGGAEIKISDTGVVLVGMMEPTGVINHFRPNQLSFVLKYAGPASLENVVWTKDKQAISVSGFNIVDGTVTEDGFALTTNTATKLPTVQTDGGLYEVAFDRQLAHSSGTFETLKGTETAQVNVLAFIVDEPTDGPDNLLKILTCGIYDPIVIVENPDVWTENLSQSMTCGIYDPLGQLAEDYLLNPEYVWMFNGRPIEKFNELEEKYEITMKDGISFLKILSFDASMGGNYNCIFKYTTPENTEVIVETPTDIEVPSEVTDIIGNTSVLKGSPLVLTCRVWGYPEVTVVWIKDGVRVVPNFRISMTDVNSDHVLRIQSVTAADKGSYECVATNTLNPHGDRQTVDVTVESEKPDNVEIRAPNFVWKDKEFTVECISVPSVSDSTLILQKNAVSFADLGMFVSTEKNIYDSILETQVDKISFTISNANFDHANVYKCISCSGNGHTRCPLIAQYMVEDTHSLLIGAFLPKKSTVYQHVPDPMTMSFSYTGRDNLDRVKWSQNGIDANSKGFTVMGPTPLRTGGFLMKTHTIQKSTTSRDDAGAYLLSFSRNAVQNSVFPTEFTRSLTVKTLELIVENPDVWTKNLSQSMTCGIYDPLGQLAADYLLNPEYVWMFNGRPIEKNKELEEKYEITMEDGISFLKILSFDASMGGNYNCIFRYTTPDNTEVIVETPTDIEVPSEVTDIIGNTSVLKGSLLVLTCRVWGYPEVTVVWIKDGVSVVPNFRISMTAVNPDHVLRIQSVTAADKGRYECIATNTLNPNGDSQTVDVTVESEKPDNVEIRAPNFVWKDKEFTVECLSVPSVSDSTLILQKNAVSFADLGMFVSTEKNIYDSILEIQVDKISFTISNANFDHANVYKCISCSGNGHTGCPLIAQYMVEDTHSLLIGAFLPKKSTVYQHVPDPMTMSFSYTGRDNLDRVKWSQNGIDANSKGFTVTGPTPLRTGGFLMKTHTIQKSTTSRDDAGAYLLSFSRNAVQNSVFPTEFTRSLTVKTLELIVENPDVWTKNLSQSMTCGIYDPLGQLAADYLLNPEYVWMFNGRPIEKNKELEEKYEITMEDGISFLKILSFDASMGGNYNCIFRYTTPDNTEVIVETPTDIEVPSEVTDIIGNTSVLKGSLLVLTCRVWGYPEVTVVWIKDGVSVVPNFRISMTAVNPDHVLRIQSVTAADKGRYECIATNTLNPNGDSQTVDVTVESEKPDNVEIRAPNFVWKDKEFTVECISVPSVSDSTLILQKNAVSFADLGMFVSTEKNIYDSILETQVDKISFTISNANFDHANVYKCISCSGNGHTRCPLIAQYMVEDTHSLLIGAFLPKKSTVYQHVPDPMTMSFSYTGRDNLDRVKWSQNGIDANSKGFTVMGPTPLRTGGFLMKTHTIQKSTTSRDDAGAYLLSFSRNAVQNSVFPTEFTRSLTVKTLELIVENPDVWTKNLSQSMTCGIYDPLGQLAADYLLNPEYVWMFNGRPIEKNKELEEKYEITMEDGISFLKILSFDASMGGNYNCIFRYTTPDNTEVIVETPTDIEVPSEVTDIIGNTSVLKGSLLVLTCRVWGYPEVTVVWIKDGVSVVPNFRISMTAVNPDHVLRIQSVTAADKGRYECVATNTLNPHGDRQTVDVTVESEKPDYLVFRSELFVWVKKILKLTCIAIPTAADTTLVLYREGVNVANLGFSVRTEHDVRDATVGAQVSMLTATKSMAALADAKLYTCAACSSSGGTECSVVQTFLEVTRAVVVGTFDPQEDTIIHKVTGPLKMTLSYASPNGVTLENIVWNKGGRRVGYHGFTAASGTDTIDGINVLTESITKQNTVINDAGTYRLSFERRILQGSNRKKRQTGVLEQETFQKVVIVKTFGLTVTAPAVVTDNTNTVITCTVTDPTGQFVDQISDHYIVWTFNGQPINEVSYIRNRANAIFSNGISTLTIINSDTKVAGEYACIYSYTLPNGERETAEQIETIDGRADADAITGFTNVDQDGTLTLTCEAYGYPYPAVRWQKDGQTIYNADSRVSFTSDPPSPFYRLTITDVGRSDIGQYTCIATNRFNLSGSKKSVNVDVAIIYPDNIFIETPLYVWRRTSLVITCVAEPSVAQVTLVLLKDGTNVENERFTVDVDRNVIDNTRNTQVDRLTATLVTTHFVNAGTYTCVACSGNSHARCPSATRKIEDSRPVLVGTLDPESESIRVAAPDPIDVSVIYTGPGIIENLIWQKGGYSLSTIGFQLSLKNDRVSGYDVKRHTARKDSSKTVDGGTITASFSVIYRVGSTRIATQDLSDSINVKMFGLNLQLPTTVTIGIATRITCQLVGTDGDFTPAGNHPFTWKYFDDAPATFSQLSAHTSETDNDIQSTLVISGAASDYRISGEYTCRYTYLSGGIRKIIERTGSLSAVPVIERIGGYLNYDEDDTLELNCDVYGYPVPEVTWYKNGDIVLASDRIEMTSTRGKPQHALIITNVRASDQGEYQCQAKTAKISTPVSSSVDITVKKIPPRGLDLPIIIAIIVGVILALMILGAILICCFLKRRKRTEDDVLEEPSSETIESVTEPKEVGYPAYPADHGEWFGQDYVLFRGHAKYDRPAYMFRPV